MLTNVKPSGMVSTMPPTRKPEILMNTWNVEPGAGVFVDRVRVTAIPDPDALAIDALAITTGNIAIAIIIAGINTIRNILLLSMSIVDGYMH